MTRDQEDLVLVSVPSQLLQVFHAFTNLINFIIILVAQHDVNVHIILNYFRAEPSNAIRLLGDVMMRLIRIFGQLILFLYYLIYVIFKILYHLAHLVFRQIACTYDFILRV